MCGNPQNNFGPHKARKNLGLEAVKWKTVAKVGVAPLCLDMIYLLAAIGLSPGGSSTDTFTHKQYTERHKTNNT
jgi:hypothetical protein